MTVIGKQSPHEIFHLIFLPCPAAEEGWEYIDGHVAVSQV